MLLSFALLWWAGAPGCPGCYEVTLPRPAQAEIGRARKPGLTLAGIHRKLNLRRAAAKGWGRSPEGTPVWRVVIRSTGAAGLRVHIAGLAPGKGRLWVYDAAAAGSSRFGPYTAEGDRQGGDFWTDIVEADRVVVEYRPSGAAKILPFSVPEIAHLFLEPLAP